MRTGEEHEIPIRDRLGLLGPLDKLGQNEHKQKIIVVEDQRCELWQGVLTNDYEKKWLPKLQQRVLPPLRETVDLEEEMEMEEDEDDVDDDEAAIDDDDM